MERKPLIEVYAPRPTDNDLRDFRTFKPSDHAPKPRETPPPKPPRAVSVVGKPKD
jgi:hypothetical protein